MTPEVVGYFFPRGEDIVGIKVRGSSSIGKFLAARRALRAIRAFNLTHMNRAGTPIRRATATAWRITCWVALCADRGQFKSSTVKWRANSAKSTISYDLPRWAGHSGGNSLSQKW